MKKSHKIASCVILLVAGFMAFRFEAQMTDVAAQSLVTFFSVVFGFYMTSIAIFYDASYTKSLHNYIDKKTQKRGTHILKSYLLVSGYCSIFSVALIIIFTTVATKDTGGILSTRIPGLALPFTDKMLDSNLLLSSSLFGLSALNIFYMILLMKTVVDGMIQEARE